MTECVSPDAAEESRAEGRGRSEWHIITSQYPYQLGGLADGTYLVANGLAAAGDQVHIWCPGANVGSPQDPGVHVHREFDRFGASDLLRVGELLDRFAAPRRILLQWVPSGYGFRSINLPFCLWLWRRAREGDQIEIMAHEAFLSFAGSWKQRAAAIVQRLMTSVLSRAASRVWVSIPAYAEYWRQYHFNDDAPIEWLPVFSNIPVEADAARVATLRRRYVPVESLLVGHFVTTNDRYAAEAVPEWMIGILRECPSAHCLLLGRGSRALRETIAGLHPELHQRLHATGGLPAEELAEAIKACDLMLQPYADGVSTRRGTVLAPLAHGRAVLTTEGVHTEELWRRMRSVAMVPLHDSELAVATARELLENAEARRRLGDAARALYVERFEVRHFVERLRKSVRSPEPRMERVSNPEL